MCSNIDSMLDAAGLCATTRNKSLVLGIFTKAVHLIACNGCCTKLNEHDVNPRSPKSLYIQKAFRAYISKKLPHTNDVNPRSPKSILPWTCSSQKIDW